MKAALVGMGFGLGVGVGVCVSVAAAGPLEKGRVDKAAAWVVHVDVEGAVKSTAGKFVVEHRKSLDLEPLDEFKKHTGLDVFTDIKDVTVYGLTAEFDRGVALVRGTGAFEAAMQRLAAEEKSVERVEVGGRQLISWKEGGTKRYGFMKADGDAKLLVVAQHVESLEGAIKVLEGKAESGAQEKVGVFAKTPRRGTIVFFAATAVDTMAGEEAFKMLKSAREIRAELGEDRDGMYAAVQVVAAGPDDIQDIAGLANGMISVGKMAMRGEPEMKDMLEVLQGIKIEAKGNVLSGSARISKELLTAALEDARAEIEKEKRGAEAVQVKDGGKAEQKPKGNTTGEKKAK